MVKRDAFKNSLILSHSISTLQQVYPQAVFYPPENAVIDIFIVRLQAVSGILSARFSTKLRLRYSSAGIAKGIAGFVAE